MGNYFPRIRVRVRIGDACARADQIYSRRHVFHFSPGARPTGKAALGSEINPNREPVDFDEIFGAVCVGCIGNFLIRYSTE